MLFDGIRELNVVCGKYKFHGDILHPLRQKSSQSRWQLSFWFGPEMREGRKGGEGDNPA
jgi:hypothetical protein